LTGLANILTEWNSSTFDYTTRIQHLTGTSGGDNAGTFLYATTVDIDSDKDSLACAAGSDWFVLSDMDKFDLKKGEEKLTI